MTPPPTPAAPTPTGAHPVRVLVCDDDARITESLVEALAQEPFVVESTGRAVDAIQKVMRETYHAVVLDLKLPGLGGLDAIGVIKRIDQNLPVIAMTGYATYETEQAARAAGIFYYLVKPFALQELTEAVRAAVRARESGKTRR